MFSSLVETTDCSINFRDLFGCTPLRCGCEVFAMRGSSKGRPEPGICVQNKTPQTHSSHGTLVDQPSPKCCSRRRLNRSRSWGNGSSVPCPSPTVISSSAQQNSNNRRDQNAGREKIEPPPVEIN